MNKDNFCVIMAGGIGTRFWPMSTTKHPKQFHDVRGKGQTLIQATFKRLSKIAPVNQIYVITNQEYIGLTLEQLPEISASQVISEPATMNTAACNIYAAAKIHQINPNARILVVPSDHLIEEVDNFAKIAIDALNKATDENILITLGISPTRADTGYGYIKYDKTEISSLKKVIAFKEKPDKVTAKKFVKLGNYLWNSGIFVWSSQAILEAFKTYLPEMYKSFTALDSFYNTDKEQEEINKIYSSVEKISIDYGVMEHAENVFVIPSDFGWSDLGTWASLYENLPKDKNENVTAGNNIYLYDSENNMVKTNQDKIIVIKGLDDFIVVDTPEALLICPKKNDQQVKDFVNNLRD